MSPWISALLGFCLGAAMIYLWRAVRIAQMGAQINELKVRTQTAEEKLSREREDRLRMSDEFRRVASDTIQNATQQLVSDALKDFRQIKTEADHSLDSKKDLFQAAVSDMKVRLDDTMKSVQRFEEERLEMYGGLKNSIEQMLVAGHSIRMETAALKKALTSSSGVQGNFGQMLLEQILEQNGLIKGVGYETQVVFDDGAGGVLRPDVLIHLPGNKKLIIDAKAPIGEYLLAQETEDAEKQKEHYTKLAANLRDNMNRLSKKEYQSLTDSDIRFVLMFVPEGPIRAAFSSDPSLLRDSQAKNVLLASPMTIMPLIQLIAYSWQQVRLAENAKELGGEVEILGQRFFTFMEHVQDIQQGLKKAQEGWNRAAGSWKTRLLPQLEKVKGLGGKMKDIPEPEALSEEIADSPLHQKQNLLE